MLIRRDARRCVAMVTREFTELRLLDMTWVRDDLSQIGEVRVQQGRP